MVLLNRPGSLFSYKLQYIVGFGFVEMATSANPKPTIYRNLYQNTDPGVAYITRPSTKQHWTCNECTLIRRTMMDARYLVDAKIAVLIIGQTLSFKRVLSLCKTDCFSWHFGGQIKQVIAVTLYSLSSHKNAHLYFVKYASKKLSVRLWTSQLFWGVQIRFYWDYFLCDYIATK